jgi:hypothetical protein
MKLVIFHDTDEQKTAARLFNAVTSREHGAGLDDAALFEFAPDWERNPAPFSAKLAGITHLLLFKQKKKPKWFSFLAGFARGKGCPIVYYGVPGMKKPAYVPDIVVCRDEVELIRYLQREFAAFGEKETVEKARKTLFDTGIPVTPDSFANCVREGNIEAVKLFLEARISAGEKDKNGVPMLCVAARAGQEKLIPLLLDAGAAVNSTSADRGNTALIDAALGKHTTIIERLIAAGADVNAKSKDGQSALIIAVGLTDTATSSLLLNAGADPDTPDLLGVTARKYAQLFHNPKILELFEQ